MAVVLCAAAAAALVFFWYLPGRDTGIATVSTASTASTATTGSTASTAPELVTSTTAGVGLQSADLVAMALVRQAMTALESAFVDLQTCDPATMTPAVLAGIDPAITFIVWPDATASATPTALAADSAVDYAGNEFNYAIGTVSASGTTFGVIVNKEGSGDTWYYVDGAAQDWDDVPETTPTTLPLTSTTASGV